MSHREFDRLSNFLLDLYQFRDHETFVAQALQTLHRLIPCERVSSNDMDISVRRPAPNYSLDVLMTDFHLPKTTLLILVSAFAGVEPIRRAYEEAVPERYRFHSYGDAMLII